MPLSLASVRFLGSPPSVPCPPLACACGPAPNDGTNKSRKCRRGGKNGARHVTSVLDGPWERDSLLWPSELHVRIDDDSHVKQGWWAIDTVNPNAWPAAADYLKRTSVEVVAVQDAKVESGRHIDEAEQSMRACKWTASLEPCVVSQGEGKSAGVAVAVRSHIGLSKPAPVEIA